MAELPNDIIMLLGEMKAQIAAMQETVAIQGTKSDERGARTYRELESIRLDISQMSRDLESVKRRMDTAETTLKDINRWKERMIGMQIVVLAFAGILGMFAPAFVTWLTSYFGWH